MYKYLRAITVFILLSNAGCNGLSESLLNEDLGHNYHFGQEGGFTLIYRDRPTRKCIPALVTKYKYNENFIVAKQKNYKLNQKDIDSQSVDESLNLVYKKGVTQYWIIVHSQDSVYGPLSKMEFEGKRDILNVPNTLDLD